MLERIRDEGWRVILDEAQDADPKQFAVLVEIARPRGAARGDMARRGGVGPRPGHFCMVGDAQQGIYSDRADIRNFQRHIAAFAEGDGGERLTFDVTFRTPRRVVRLLNGTLAGAFGPGRGYNLGLPPAEGAPAPLLQVAYEPLVPGRRTPRGAHGSCRSRQPGRGHAPGGRPEARGRGPPDRRLLGVGRARRRSGRRPGATSASWPRATAWLPIIRDEFEAAGLKVALQMRRNRNGDNPVYAWLCGLLAVVCDPENTFEWVGVLREVFAVSDSVIAAALAGGGRPALGRARGTTARPVRAALEVLGPFIDRADSEGESLGRFAHDLAAACGLAAMARLADPEGGLGDELARLLARAEELGAGGAGPRAWLRDLLESIDGYLRAPAGRRATPST